MVVPKYRDYADFQREHIRPGLRLGWSLDSIVDPASDDAELDFDEDPFEQALLEPDEGESADGDAEEVEED